MDRLKKRGLKRRCQNDGCALPFYDLNRPQFACPTCGTAFIAKIEPPTATRTNWRSHAKPILTRHVELPVEQEAEDALDDAADVADEDADLKPSTEAETLLETDDDVENVPIDPSAERTVDE